jgi:hypothetical protein
VLEGGGHVAGERDVDEDGGAGDERVVDQVRGRERQESGIFTGILIFRVLSGS